MKSSISGLDTVLSWTKSRSKNSTSIFLFSFINILFFKKYGDLIPPLIYLNKFFFNSCFFNEFSKLDAVRLFSNKNFSYFTLENLLLSSSKIALDLILFAKAFSERDTINSQE